MQIKWWLHVPAPLFTMSSGFWILEFTWFHMYSIFLMLCAHWWKIRTIGYYTYQQRTILKCIPGFLSYKNSFGRQEGNFDELVPMPGCLCCSTTVHQSPFTVTLPSVSDLQDTEFLGDFSSWLQFSSLLMTRVTLTSKLLDAGHVHLPVQQHTVVVATH